MDKHFILPESSDSHNHLRILELARTLQDIHLGRFEELDKLQVGQQKVKESQTGQTVRWLKNPDIRYSGIVLGKVIGRTGSDFLVEASNGGQAKLLPVRINMVYENKLDI